ncbi:hypothetical protein ACFFHT_05750 [Gallibacterium melopsittaci]|uniref:Uncharacterized protein n=1 Tax=Gallibacterium melopsittaci TaxID=516063 RepID=A0ABV6HWP6_9PAST
MKETKNSALTIAKAYHYQSIVALYQCFKMREGDLIYIEKDGDISHISNHPNISTQIEVKDIKASLTDLHESFWKTLKNWLAPEFNHHQYKTLVLHTTQLFGKTTKLIHWNNSDAKNRLKILQEIYSNISKPNDIHNNVINTNKYILLEIISKVILCTESDDKDEILSEIRNAYLRGIPKNNQHRFIESLIGFIYQLANGNTWSISCEVFNEKLIDLTSQFSRKEFTFPEFTGIPASEQEVKENEDKTFVIKIKDINYDEVIHEAIGNWLEFIQSLNQELDNSPVYHEKTKKYQDELIRRYKNRHRRAIRNAQDPKDFYDSIIDEIPFPIGNDNPPAPYRNGIIHESMDTYNELKWDTK